MQIEANKTCVRCNKLKSQKHGNVWGNKTFAPDWSANLTEQSIDVNRCDNQAKQNKNFSD